MSPTSLLIFIKSGLLVFLTIKNTMHGLALQTPASDDNLRNFKEMPEIERREILCNRGYLLLPDIEKDLKCRYVNREDPFLKIAPFKEEEVFLEPRILVFHNVISDREIQVIRDLAQPKFIKAGFINATTGKIEVNAVLRKTTIGWLQDFEHEYVKKLSRRIQQMTQLTVDTAEQLQIAYYETGGHYLPHYDFAIEKDMDMFKHLGTGNRIATVLFYLNDVEEGGHTVFTEIQVSLKPKKGSAAFWYNLKPNGERDFQTRHSACPVISGVKWAANKWLHVVGQEFHRPCPLNNKTVILN